MACIMVLHVATAVFYSRSRKVLERSAFQCTVKMILAAFSIETRGFRIRMVTLQQMGSVLASRASHIYLIYTLSHVKWTIARSSTHLWRFHEKRSFVSIGIRTTDFLKHVSLLRHLSIPIHLFFSQQRLNDAEVATKWCHRQKRRSSFWLPESIFYKNNL